jgi:hypothetical protein
VCSTHKCKLLKNLLEGTITHHKAEEIVIRMKDTVHLLKRDLQEIIKKKKTHDLSLIMRDFYEQFPCNRLPIDIKKKYAVRLMTYAKFQFMKKKYFYE